MKYAYLGELNKTSLLERTSASLDAYKDIEKASRRMGIDSTMTLAERVQLYEQLKDLRAKGELPPKYNQTIATLERAFSQIEVSVPSATEEGEVSYVYDMSGNRVTLKQLLDNPDAQYKWVCETSFEWDEGDDLVDTNYVKKQETTVYKENPNGGPARKVEVSGVPVDGVSLDTSGCVGTTYAFEASGRTILGDIQTDKGYSSFLSVDYSINLFR